MAIHFFTESTVMGRVNLVPTEKNIGSPHRYHLRVLLRLAESLPQELHRQTSLRRYRIYHWFHLS
jgi:hypothetical protein